MRMIFGEFFDRLIDFVHIISIEVSVLSPPIRPGSQFFLCYGFSFSSFFFFSPFILDRNATLPPQWTRQRDELRCRLFSGYYLFQKTAHRGSVFPMKTMSQKMKRNCYKKKRKRKKKLFFTDTKIRSWGILISSK